ncbi:DUF924 domain-containing protein [Pseudoluteimonas lycopersici]|uniref:DUF924 domain-containing protein n=1 Tax=Pseudoluteimonas lycopersici TaxID=1324796 RepID=A0A516V8E0_9GAMM|nr:DUF924 domain-containing protein [Lysobacter lycopersici]
MVPNDVLAFWRDAGASKWFNGGADFDVECRTRFLEAHFSAARREFDGWTEDAEGALALVLLLDQIPRNVFRGSGHAFATDGLAREVARNAVDAGFDMRIDVPLRIFFYMPFEHSEAMADQDRSLQLLTAMGDANYVDYARRHREVIARFGRFPHRNAVLGRISTPEERAWLEAGGGF